MDMFNKLPQTMIENILCRIPIQEAARTSILAKEWRYHWTKIPKLVLDEDMFNVSSCVDDAPPPEERLYNLQTLRKGKSYWCKLYYAYYQILLKHEGPIDEFTLRVCAYDECVEIAYIVSYLLRNYSVKTLTLELFWGYVLPLPVFSFQQLTELHLIGCDLAYKTITSNVFDSLTSLYMSNVITTKKAFLHLFRCPLLKSLTIVSSSKNRILILIGFHGVPQYCKLLQITDSQAFDDSQDFDDYTITDLFECFPMVENLSICLLIMEYFEKGGVPKELPTTLIHLKYVHIIEMSFIYEYGLPFLLFLIRSSPNMEKLKLRVNGYYVCEDLVLRSQKCSSTLITHR
ncbi:F-box/FBD/LRR-repeat protein At1g13570-like [Bidens hawaiensis]|uniref:F-box/FBD/LRR-repeat protein At1g13570-like n=1 Tax=Bidens hawaiensis TaxID=980011 RepID=UPI00404A9C5E